jgi:preprotein translocase subunit SecF
VTTRGIHFVSPGTSFYGKSIMNKFTKWLFAIWMVLAIVAFISAFFTPVVFIKIIGIVFGSMNSLVILSWVIAILQARIEYQKHQRDFGTGEMS